MKKKSLLTQTQLALWNPKGDSYLSVAIKMLIAVLVGAMVLAGLYVVTRDVVIVGVEDMVVEIFDRTANSDDVGGGNVSGNGGSGGGGNELILATTFADNSWADIALACQRNEVPDTWSVGDTKPMTIYGNEIDIMIIGKNHDEYADGGIAPLTFMTKQIVEQRAVNSSNTNAGGWDGSELYAYLNGELLNNLEYKGSIKAVKKATNIGAADAGGEATTIRTTYDKLFLLSCIEVDSTETGIYAKEGKIYEAFADDNARKLTDIAGSAMLWWLRSPSCDSSLFGNIFTSGNLAFNTANLSSRGIVFAFCF